MKKFIIILLFATVLSLAACQTPVLAPTPTPTATATITLTPTPEIIRVGGVMEADGMVRYTSKKAGISFALPVEWLCVNDDEDLYTASLEAAQASMSGDFTRFENYLNNLTTFGNTRLYCFIPEPDRFATYSDLALIVLETEQLGFDNILDIVDYEYGDTTCEVTELAVDARQAAASLCQFSALAPGMVTKTFLDHYYDILDGGRYITLQFRGVSSRADQMASTEQAVVDSFRFEQ